MQDTTTTTRPAATDAKAARESAVAWLETEFPGWDVHVDTTSSWQGDLRALWIARRDGHHPQAELSPAKLHSRLSDYLHRQERKRALAN